MKLSHPIPAAVVAIVAVLALDGAAAPAQTAPAPAAARRDPRPQPGRSGSFGLGLHEPQYLRQRRLAQGESPAGRPVLLGLLLDPLRGEPRQAPRRAREGRREQVCRRRQRRTEDRRLLGELHGRGGHRSRRGQTDPGGARPHREDCDARRSAGGDHAPADAGRQRGLRLHGGAGPQDVDRGHRHRVAGRARPSRRRVLHEDRRRVEEAPRAVRGARRADAPAPRRRCRRRPRRTRRPSWLSRRGSPRRR